MRDPAIAKARHNSTDVQLSRVVMTSRAAVASPFRPFGLDQPSGSFFATVGPSPHAEGPDLLIYPV